MKNTKIIKEAKEMAEMIEETGGLNTGEWTMKDLLQMADETGNWTNNELKILAKQIKIELKRA